MSFVRNIAVVAVCLSLCGGALGQPGNGGRASDDELKTFLQRYLTLSDAEAAETYSITARVGLSGRNIKEIIVYISGQRWCGSGGCNMLVLVPDGPTFKVVGETSITRLPIRVLTTKTNGWHEIGVWVQGGGIQPGYEAVLSFDGERYPSNPTVKPARRSRKHVEGRVVINRSAKEMPLVR